MRTQAFGRAFSGVWCALFGALLSAATAAAAEPAPPPKEGGPDLTELSLEELATQAVVVATPTPITAAAAAAAPAAPVGLQQVVSTVSRQESTLARSPAAVFVITQEMIRRSGATSIPEALRMCPGLDVARAGSHTWAISARGFNGGGGGGAFGGAFSNKLLVQVDGRVVYNPVTSGVFWDTLDVLLPDVERIEVIRGPGGTVWGANAVNGVINIITKSAKETQGGLITGGGGTQDRNTGGFRYGGKIGDDVYYRIWGNENQDNEGFNRLNEAQDSWRQDSGGFRFDWLPSDYDTVTLQGDLFDEEAGTFTTHPSLTPLTPPPFKVSSFSFSGHEEDRFGGGDVLWRWSHKIAKDSDWQLQAYYNNFALHANSASFDINTFALDFQQQFPLSSRQQVIYGLGYHLDAVLFGPSNFDNGFQTRAIPPFRDLAVASAFVQDQFTLVQDRLYFTVGSKFEHNTYTGFEYQPTARLLWTPSDRQSAWASISRAVRTPDFLERQVQATTAPIAVVPIGPGVPIFGRLNPNPAYGSEDLIAYEVGYRAQPTQAFSYDVALFANDYRNLEVLALGATAPLPPAAFVLPFTFENRTKGETYGAELAANWKPTPKWRLDFAYTFLDMDLQTLPQIALNKPGGAAPVASAGQSPRNEVYLQSGWDLPARLEFDLIGRYVDDLPAFNPVVRSYIEMDARLGWRPCRNMEMAIIGQNLLQEHHLETGSGATAIEIPRGVYGTVSWRW